MDDNIIKQRMIDGILDAVRKKIMGLYPDFTKEEISDTRAEALEALAVVEDGFDEPAKPDDEEDAA